MRYYKFKNVELNFHILFLGIINTADNRELFFLYAPRVKTKAKEYIDIIKNNGITTWDITTYSETVGLKSGETKLLGIFRNSGKDSLRTYDFENKDLLKKIIEEDETVLLLKVKVEYKEE